MLSAPPPTFRGVCPGICANRRVGNGVRPSPPPPPPRSLQPLANVGERGRPRVLVDKKQPPTLLLWLPPCKVKADPGHALRASPNNERGRVGPWSGAGVGLTHDPGLPLADSVLLSQTSRCPSLGLSGLKFKSLLQRRTQGFCPSLSSHTGPFFLWFANCTVREAPRAGLPAVT